jgi:hypothetical protein
MEHSRIKEGIAMDMRKFNDKLPGPALSVLRLKTNRGITLALIFALALVFFPAEAYPDCDVKGDIPFTVSNDAVELCFQCTGPWARTSEVVKLNAGEKNCTFYAAKKTIFVVYGDWGCTVFTIGADGNCDTIDPIVGPVDYCLKKSSPSPQFTIEVIDGSISLDSNLTSPPPFCPSSVSAFLGDNRRQEKSKPDTDVFLFDGADGDGVTLRLEADPQGGHNGSEAIFGISGNSLNESTSGTPPLELDVTLPGDGKYSITVEQPRHPKDQRFRGGYILDVESAMGVGLIEPSINVEK